MYCKQVFSVALQRLTKTDLLQLTMANEIMLLCLWFVFFLLPKEIHSASASIRSGISGNIGGGSVEDVKWIDLMTVPEIAMAIPVRLIHCCNLVILESLKTTSHL